MSVVIEESPMQEIEMMALRKRADRNRPVVIMNVKSSHHVCEKTHQDNSMKASRDAGSGSRLLLDQRQHGPRRPGFLGKSRARGRTAGFHTALTHFLAAV